MAIPAAGDLFKATFDEPLKRLLQPAGIVPALVLIGLDLVVLYPVLLDEQVPLAVAFGDLDATWQLGVTATAIVLIGYVILAFSPSVLRVATGESWRTSFLRSAFLRLQKRSLRVLETRQTTTPAEKRARDTERYARFPRHADDLSPTALGNALSAIGDGIYQSYGLDITATWTHMREAIRKDAEPMLKEIDDDEVGFLSLLNVAAVLVIFALQGTTLALAVGQGSFFVAAVLALAGAYVAYRAAVGRVMAWGDRVAASYDLYRKKLRELMSVGKATTAEYEVRQNRELSGALAWDVPVRTYMADEKPVQLVVASPSLTAVVLNTEKAGPIPRGSSAAPEVLWVSEYVVEIKGTDKDKPSSGIVDITDRDLPARIPSDPVWSMQQPAGAIGVVVRRSALGLRDHVRWTVTDLAAGKLLVLTYRLEWKVSLRRAPGRATPATIRFIEGVSDIRGWSTLAAEVSFKRASDLRLELVDDRVPDDRSLGARYRSAAGGLNVLAISQAGMPRTIAGRVGKGTGRVEVYQRYG